MTCPTKMRHVAPKILGIKGCNTLVLSSDMYTLLVTESFNLQSNGQNLSGTLEVPAIRVTSHTRLRARDHCTSSTLMSPNS